jgi:hypothetical protein
MRAARAFSSQASRADAADAVEELPTTPQYQQQHQTPQHVQQQGAGAVAPPAPREAPEEQKVSVMAFYVGQKLDLISVRFCVCGLCFCMPKWRVVQPPTPPFRMVP